MRKKSSTDDSSRKDYTALPGAKTAKSARAHGSLVLILVFAALFVAGCGQTDQMADITKAIETGDLASLEPLIVSWLERDPNTAMPKLEFLARTMLEAGPAAYEIIAGNVRAGILERGRDGLVEQTALSARDLVVRGLFLEYLGDRDGALASYERATQLDSLDTLAARSYAVCQAAESTPDTHGHFEVRYSGNMKYLADGVVGQMPSAPADPTFRVWGSYTTRVEDASYSGDVEEWIYIYDDEAKTELVGWGVCVNSGTVVVTREEMAEILTSERDQFEQTFDVAPYDAMGRYFVVSLDSEKEHRLVLPVTWVGRN